MKWIKGGGIGWRGRGKIHVHVLFFKIAGGVTVPL